MKIHLAQSDTTAALEALRSGEPPLGDLTSDEQSWLVNAISCLNAIYQKRAIGKPGDSPFCIFALDLFYVQFLAPSDAEQLVCEAVSATSIPDVATALTPEREKALQDLGFDSPGVSPNYFQIIEIANFADLGYAARLALHTLRAGYGVANFRLATFDLTIPVSRLSVGGYSITAVTSALWKTSRAARILSAECARWRA